MQRFHCDGIHKYIVTFSSHTTTSQLLTTRSLNMYANIAWDCQIIRGIYASSSSLKTYKWIIDIIHFSMHAWVVYQKSLPNKYGCGFARSVIWKVGYIREVESNARFDLWLFSILVEFVMLEAFSGIMENIWLTNRVLDALAWLTLSECDQNLNVLRSQHG